MIKVGGVSIYGYLSPTKKRVVQPPIIRLTISYLSSMQYFTDLPQKMIY